MNIIRKYFNKQKEADQAEDGLKIYLDFELKTFKFLNLDNFTTSEQVSLIIINDVLKTGETVTVNGQETANSEEISTKKYSALFLIIKLHNSNNVISQRKLNFYESPLKIMQEKDKNYDYFIIFSLNETSFLISPLAGRKNSKKMSAGTIKKITSPKKKKKNEMIFNFDEEYIRSGNLKKQTKKGDFQEKIFVLFKDKLIYYEPKDKENKKEIQLIYAKLDKLQDMKEKSNVFEIKTLKKSYFLQTSNNLISWMNDIKFQIKNSTDNKILSEYEKYIQQREIKNMQNLQQTIEKISTDFQENLKYEVFRDWFTSFLIETHPEESGLMILINLFYKSQTNRAMIDAKKKNEATLIYINLLHETIKLAKKTHTLKKESFESESESTTNNETSSNNPDPQSIQVNFHEEFYSIIKEELWNQIDSKYQELKNSMICENCTDLLNEVFNLFQILNENLISYLRKYSDNFFESIIFKAKFSQNYMRKSCLINSFWFQKPIIKYETIKFQPNQNNNLSPLKNKPRERNLTTVNLPKTYKEYDGGVAQSMFLSNTFNSSMNDKL